MTPYVKFLLLFFGIPLAALLITHRKTLWRYRKTIALGATLTFAFGVPWDVISVLTGLWRYDSAPTLGVWFGVLPLEELVFTLVYPVVMLGWALVLRERLRS